VPVTIVVGGQYGSEGKGKVVALLAARAESPWLVRCGGPNSGHTVTIEGRDVVLRQVPSCSEPATATFCLAAGCAIDEVVLLDELDLLGIERDRIIVDPRAVVIRPSAPRPLASRRSGSFPSASGKTRALLSYVSSREQRIACRNLCLRSCRVASKSS
jgi:adenylosuccinate synthase